MDKGGICHQQTKRTIGNDQVTKGYRNNMPLLELLGKLPIVICYHTKHPPSLLEPKNDQLMPSASLKWQQVLTNKDPHRLPVRTLWTICSQLSSNMSAQKYFCKNVNHLNLCCALFIEDILCEKLKLSHQIRVGPDWASHIFSFSYKSTYSILTEVLIFRFFFVFSNQYKIFILMICNMTISDKTDFSPLREVSPRKPCSLNST